LDLFPVATDQGFFLSPAPAFDTALRVYRIDDTVESLRIDQSDWPTPARVTLIRPGVMLTETLVEALSAGGAHIIASVRTSQHIDEGIHRAATLS